MVAEVFIVLGRIKHAKAHLREWMEPEERETGFVFLPASVELVRSRSASSGSSRRGTTRCSSRWRPLVGALAAGNRAMLKPSELVPETAALLHDLVAETFPPDQVTVVTGGTEVGEAFSRLPFDHLVFTGSTRVGKLVMRAASENLVPVTLELGGKSPTIVAKDFSTRDAPPSASWPASCSTPGRRASRRTTCWSRRASATRSSRPARRPSRRCTRRWRRTPTTRRSSTTSTTRASRATSRTRRRTGAKVVELNPHRRRSIAGARKMAPTLVLDPTDEMLVHAGGDLRPGAPGAHVRNARRRHRLRQRSPAPARALLLQPRPRSIDRVLAETISGGVTVNETMLHVGAGRSARSAASARAAWAHYHAHEGFETFTKKKPVFRQARINTTGLLRPPYGKMLDRLLAVLIGR